MIPLVIGFSLLISTLFGFLYLALNTRLVASRKYDDRIRAQDAALNVMTKVLREIKYAGRLDYAETTEYEFGSSSEASIIFYTPAPDTTPPTEPYSVNNLESSSALRGWKGRAVPGSSLHLVAVAKSGSRRIAYEQLITQDALPWSVATNGRIIGNDMQVFSLDSLDQANDGIQPEEQDISNILSNSTGAGSIELTGDSLVTGDAQAVGGVQIVAPSEVQGEILADDSENEVDIRLARTATDFASSAALPFGTQLTEIQGHYDFNGDLTISDLELKDAILYVNGNLTVTGTVKGYGALVSTQDITITGTMETQASLAALVADGSIEIRGSASNPSSFRGLILAGGSFRATDTTVLGSVLSLDQSGTVELERVTAASSQSLQRVDVTIIPSLEPAFESSQAADAGGATFGILYNGQFVKLDRGNLDALEAQALQIAADNAEGQVVYESSPGVYSTTPPGGFIFQFQTAFTSWETFEGEVKSGIDYKEEIFTLDFNEFVKQKGGFRLLDRWVTIL